MGELKYTYDYKDTYEKYSYSFMGYLTDYTKGKVGGTDSITTYKTYYHNGSINTETDGKGNTTSYTYDDANRQKTKEITVGGVLHRTSRYYDADYQYDSLGRRISTSQGGIKVELLVYNNRNLQTESWKVYQGQPDGPNTYIKTAYAYDHGGRLISTAVDPTGLNRVTSQEYDNHGNVSARYDENSRKTAYRYDGLNRLLNVTNPKGEAVDYAYDLAGNPRSQTRTFKDTDNGAVQTSSLYYEYNSLDKIK